MRRENGKQSSLNFRQGGCYRLEIFFCNPGPSAFSDQIKYIIMTRYCEPGKVVNNGLWRFDKPIIDDNA
jgi:hypothetical protein